MAGLVVVLVIEGLAPAVADAVHGAVEGLAAPLLVVAAVLVVVVVALFSTLSAVASLVVVLVISDQGIEAGFSSGSFFAGRLNVVDRVPGADAGLEAVAGAKRAVAGFFVGSATGLKALVGLTAVGLTAGLLVASVTGLEALADLGLTAVGPGLAGVLKEVSGLLVTGLAAAFGFGLDPEAAIAAGLDLSKLLLAAVALTTAGAPAAAVAVSCDEDGSYSGKLHGF